MKSGFSSFHVDHPFRKDSGSRMVRWQKILAHSLAIIRQVDVPRFAALLLASVIAKGAAVGKRDVRGFCS